MLIKELIFIKNLKYPFFMYYIESFISPKRMHIMADYSLKLE